MDGNFLLLTDISLTVKVLTVILTRNQFLLQHSALQLLSVFIAMIESLLTL